MSNSADALSRWLATNAPEGLLEEFFESHNLCDAFKMGSGSLRERIDLAFKVAKTEGRLGEVFAAAKTLGANRAEAESLLFPLSDDPVGAILELAIQAAERARHQLSLQDVVEATGMNLQVAGQLMRRLEDDGLAEVAINFGDGMILSARILRVTADGYRRAVRLPTNSAVHQSQDEDWIPPRLWGHIAPSVTLARRTGLPTDWSRVTREACLFLEDELRARTGDTSRTRQTLAANALRSQGGRLNLNKSPDVQDAWMHFVQGIFGALSNPGAHTIRRHSPAFAMGCVGAVALVLDTLDSELGPLTT